jgi:hypothetical protein
MEENERPVSTGLTSPRPSDPLLDETASQIGINEPSRRTTNRVAKR